MDFIIYNRVIDDFNNEAFLVLQAGILLGCVPSPRVQNSLFYGDPRGISVRLDHRIQDVFSRKTNINPKKKV